MKHLFIVIIAIITFSCKDFLKLNKQIINDNSRDTIKPVFRSKNSYINKQIDIYYTKYDLVISKYYSDISFKEIDINSDNKKDTLIILSPIGLLYNDSLNEIIEDKNHRLLIIKMNNNLTVYDNVIRNEWGLGATGAENIKESFNGFKLTNHFGQSCFFDYEINVEFYKNKFFITNILTSSGCPGEKTKKRSIHYKKFDLALSQYKRILIDSLLDNN